MSWLKLGGKNPLMVSGERVRGGGGSYQLAEVGIFWFVFPMWKVCCMISRVL